MPTVRRAERSVEIAPLQGGMKHAAETPQSEGAGLQRAKADTSLAVADFAGRVSQITGDAYAQMKAEERKASDETALLKASNQISDWKNQRLFNPDGGALTLKGEDALPLPEQIKGEFDQVAGSIEATLSTPEQKAAFARLRSQEGQSIDLTVRRHVFEQVQEYRTGELKSLIDNSSNEAIQQAADPKLVAVSLQKAVSAIETSGPGLGMGKEAIAVQVRAVQSKTHVGVISTLLAQEKTQQAADYFAAAKGQIDGDKQDQIIAALDAGTLRGQSQQAADAILRTAATPKAAREAAQAIADPKLRDEVEQRIEHAQAVAEKEDRDAEQETMRAGYDILDKTGDVTKIPPSTWASYSGNTRSAMRSYALQRAKGTPTETDPETYYNLMRVARDKPAEFATWNLLQYRHKLDDSDFKQLAGLQLSVARSDTKAAEKELAPYDVDRQVLDDSLATYGINPKPKDGTKEAAAIAQLRNMVRRRGDAIQALTGKPATNADIQSEIDRILSTSTTVPGSWWNLFPGGASVSDTQKRLIDTTPAEIPAADRAQIEAALRARNRPVSDATVLDLYLEGQMRKKR